MKKSPILVVVLIFSGLAACQNENPNREIIKPSGDPALVSVTIKGGSGNMISRANGTPIPGTPQEDNFTKIEFFVYEEDGSPDTSYPYFSPTATTGTYTFLVTAGENKKFIVAINQELGAAAAGTTYSEMKQTLAKKMLFTASQNDSQTAIDDGIGYAMAGEGTQTVTQGNPNRLDITVSRLLSRVRTPKVKGADGNFALTGTDVFPYSAVPDAALDEYLTSIFGQDYIDLAGAPVEDLKWEFTGYVLINGVDRSYTIENELNDAWNPDGKIYFKTIYEANSDGSIIEEVYGGSGTGDLFIAPYHIEEIFIYENNPALLSGTGTNNNPAIFMQDEVTAFLIRGQFSASNIDAGNPVTRYWRINMIKDDIWKIYRNCVYQITMNTINTPGFATPKDAEEDGPIVHPDESSISIDLNIAPWGYKTQGVDL